jgi:hypothetical protein
MRLILQCSGLWFNPPGDDFPDLVLRIAVIEGFRGARLAVSEAEELVDFVFRKNEAILGGVVGFVFLLMHLDEVGGLFELLLAGFQTLGLDLAEKRQRLFELAGQALGVDAESGESAGLIVECGGYG